MKGRKFVNEGKRRGAGEGYLYGPHVVEGWLQAGTGRLRQVWVKAKPHGRLADIADMARAAGVVVQEAGTEQLSQRAGTSRHQGVVGLADEFEYASFEEVLGARPDPVVMLDQIQDPRNLGAILRTAGAVSARGIILPKHGTVGLTASVEVAAAGAASRLQVARVTNLVRTVGQLRESGYWTLALDARAEVSIFQVDIPSPTVLVIGGETGVRPLLSRSCDQTASIPMPGGVESLNVSVAAAIALYEIHRRRPGGGGHLP